MAKDHKPRLPVGQLSVLSLVRLAEPISLSSVYPYLPEMIESFGVKPSEVSQWVGITSAVFALTQSLTAIPLGSASDVLGRKPTLLFGLFIIMCATVLFGFSSSLPMAIIARGLAGAGSGTTGISRTAVAEMVSHKELQPRAFSIMPLMWSIGSIIGPVFGGALAKPAEQYPDLFGNSPFANKFPFALPNLIAGIVFFLGVSTGILFLKETLETKKHTKDYGLVLGRIISRPFDKQRSPKKSIDDNEEGSPRHSPRRKPAKVQPAVRYRDIFTWQSSLNLVAYTILAFHTIAFDQLIPVFLHGAPQDPSERHLPWKFAGGFGLNSGRIGAIFTVYAVIAVFIQFLIFPPTARHYGVLRCFRVATAFGPVAYFLMPFTVLMPTPATQQIAFAVVMCMRAIVGVFSFPCTTILLTNSISSLRLLGLLNGVATSISALGRASGPAICGWLFTVGMKTGYVVLPWWALSFVGLLGHISTYFLVEMDGPRPDQDDDVAEIQAAQDEGQENQPLLGRERAYDTSRQYNTIMQDRRVRSKTENPHHDSQKSLMTESEAQHDSN